MEKPSFVDDEHLHFLDELMQSGRMTSFRVSQLMMHKYPLLSFEQVNTVITYWIFSYASRHEEL